MDVLQSLPNLKISSSSSSTATTANGGMASAADQPTVSNSLAAGSSIAGGSSSSGNAVHSMPIQHSLSIQTPRTHGYPMNSSGGPISGRSSGSSRRAGASQYHLNHYSPQNLQPQQPHQTHQNHSHHSVQQLYSAYGSNRIQNAQAQHQLHPQKQQHVPQGVLPRIPQAYHARRDPKRSPLMKLSVNLVETYININKHFYSQEKKKRTGQQQQQQSTVNAATTTSATASTCTDKKIKQPSNNNNGYDDENDDYIFKEGEVWEDRFYIRKQLGRGSFGQVFEAYDHTCNQNVAIKVIKNRKTFYNQALTEIRILDYLNKKDPDDSKFIVRMKEHFIHQNHLCIVYEILSMSLYEVLRRSNFAGLPLNLVRKFATQILTTLSFLGRKDVQVIHCDLKPENILLRDPKKAALKVIDFGSSCFHSEKAYSYIQSRFYRSPEIIMGHSYSVAIDMWSLGCILVELLCGEPLFCGQTEHDQMCRICDLLGLPPPALIETGNATKVSKLFAKVGDDDYRLIETKNFKPTNKTVAKLLRCHTEKLFKAYMNSAAGASSRPDETINGIPAKSVSLGPGNGTWTDHQRFAELIERMLAYDPLERITPEEALQHPFFKVSVERAVNTNHTMMPSN
ncbi:Dual specificity tyrosine-phosphorylation-regulated kinase 1A [Chytridiales sp. JEL 0842]|nr:Dual specificity tyrosine-phosphorylation-regulated kinase 1A [Chytridiales sp. JEL 0842]